LRFPIKIHSVPRHVRTLRSQAYSYFLISCLFVSLATTDYSRSPPTRSAQEGIYRATFVTLPPFFQIVVPTIKGAVFFLWRLLPFRRLLALLELLP